MNKNSNSYQIIYSAVMVLLVGTVLAFVYMALKPKQDENIANDQRKQILEALKVSADDSNVKELFDTHITKEFIVNSNGDVIDSAKNSAFNVDMKNNIKLDSAERKLPVYQCVTADGQTKYILPVYGAGLWGAIWGYVAVDDDGSTIYATSYSHASETPGLGAKITEPGFRSSFEGKKLFKDGIFTSVDVLKKGQKNTDGADYVDAISGATITSRGVKSMLQDCLKYYDGFLKKLSQNNETQISDDQPKAN